MLERKCKAVQLLILPACCNLPSCDLCVEYKKQAKRYQQDFVSAVETEVEANYSLTSSYDELLREHNLDAKRILDHYRSITKESRFHLSYF